MGKLISAMKVSLDMKVADPDDYPSWVSSWSEDYGLSDHIGACVLGAGMYPTYEEYWSAIIDHPERENPVSGTMPTEDEKEWARRIPGLPHHVLSHGDPELGWDNAGVLHDLDAVRRLKEDATDDVYLVGGATIISNAIEADILDEIRLLVYPVVSGGPNDLFRGVMGRGLERLRAEGLPDGRTRIDFAVGSRLPIEPG